MSHRSRILNLIELIEDMRGEMFHVLYPSLAELHVAVMDGKKSPLFLINELYKIIDELKGSDVHHG